MIDYDTFYELGDNMKRWCLNFYRNHTEIFWWGFGISVVIIVICIASHYESKALEIKREGLREEGRYKVRVEAVKAGVGRWVPDDAGKCTFEFIKESAE